MDANNDGYVTKDELKAMLSSLGEPVDDAVVDEMMAVADVREIKKSRLPVQQPGLPPKHSVSEEEEQV